VAGQDPTLGYQLTAFYPMLQAVQSRWTRQYKLCQKVVSTIPDTMTENWGRFTLGGKSGKDQVVQWITQKLNHMEGWSAFIELHGAAQAFNAAQCKANQTGNGAIALLINDGGDLKDPVDEKRIKSVDGFVVFDRWEVRPEIGGYYSQGKITHYRRVGYTKLVDSRGKDLISQTELIHRDRILWFRGQEILDKWELLNNYGCDDSVLDSFVGAFVHLVAAMGGMARIVCDPDSRVHKIANLLTGLESGGQAAEGMYRSRVRAFHQQLSQYNVGIIDKDLEEIDTITRSTVGLGDASDRLVNWVLANTDLFAYELLGQQINRSGLADTGKAEQENANRRTSRFQSKKFNSNIRKLLRYLLLSKESPVNGEPDSWDWQWEPLFPTTPVEQSELELNRSQILSAIAAVDPTGTMAPSILLSNYGGEEYNPNITLPKEAIKALEDAIKNPQPQQQPEDQGAAPDDGQPDQGDEGTSEDQSASLDDLISQVQSGEVDPKDAVNQAADTLGLDPSEVADYLGVKLDSIHMDWKKYDPKNKPGDTRMRNGKKQVFSQKHRWQNVKDVKPGDVPNNARKGGDGKKAISDLSPENKALLDKMKQLIEKLKESQAKEDKEKADKEKAKAKKQKPEEPETGAKQLSPESKKKTQEVIDRNSKKESEEPRKPKAKPVKHTDLIAKGDSLVPKDVQSRLEELRKDMGHTFEQDYKKTENNLRNLSQQLRDAQAGKKTDRPLADIVKAGKAEKQKYLQHKAKIDEAAKLMEGLRADLIKSSPVSEQQAQKMASKIKIDSNATSVIPEKELRSQAAEFYRLTGGRGATTIDDFTKDDDRAYANKDKRNVNIGSSKQKAIVFHEMAHHIEFENEGVGKASVDWILSRATGKVGKLKDITDNQKYNDNEFAVPDRFASPYVGKIYPERGADGKIKPRPASEVISMGVERMSDPHSMAAFYLSDPEHFKLTLGALRG
jgi:hypothetical protein